MKVINTNRKETQGKNIKKIDLKIDVPQEKKIINIVFDSNIRPPSPEKNLKIFQETSSSLPFSVAERTTKNASASTFFNANNTGLKFHTDANSNQHTIYPNTSKNLPINFTNQILKNQTKPKLVFSMTTGFEKTKETLEQNQNDFYLNNLFSRQNIILYDKENNHLDKKVITHTSTFWSGEEGQKIGYKNENEIFISKKNKANVCYFRDILGSTNTESNREYNSILPTRHTPKNHHKKEAEKQNLKVVKKESPKIKKIDQKFVKLNSGSLISQNNQEKDKVKIQNFNLSPIKNKLPHIKNDQDDQPPFPKLKRKLTTAIDLKKKNTIKLNLNKEYEKEKINLEEYYKNLTPMLGTNNVLLYDKRKANIILPKFENNNGKFVVSEISKSERQCEHHDLKIPDEKKIRIFDRIKTERAPKHQTRIQNHVSIKKGDYEWKELKERIRKEKRAYSYKLKSSVDPYKSKSGLSVNIHSTHSLSPPRFKKNHHVQMNSISPDEPLIIPKKKETKKVVTFKLQELGDDDSKDLPSRFNNVFIDLGNDIGQFDDRVEKSEKNSRMISDFTKPRPLTQETEMLMSKTQDSFYKTSHFNKFVPIHRISKHITSLINKNLEQNPEALREFEKHEDIHTKYNKDLIEQIKIINKYLEKQGKEHFLSKVAKHRKIYVILDGSTVFKCMRVPGKFIEIPTRKLLMTMPSKKQRLEKYFRFLIEATKEFSSEKRFKTLFTMNGHPIFDLVDIPEGDNAVYVSLSENFTGINLFGKNNINYHTPNPQDEDQKFLVFHKVERKKIVKRKLQFRRKNRSVIIDFERVKLNSQNNYKYYNPRDRNLDNSFTEGFKFNKIISPDEKIENSVENQEEDSIFYDYQYYSDNETKKKDRQKMLEEEYHDKYDLIYYFEAFSIHKKKIDIRNKYKKIVNAHHEKKPNEKTKTGLMQLIDKYNYERAEKFKINIKKHENDRTEEVNQATKLMMHYIQKLIFRFNNTDDLDELALGNGEKLSQKYINNNKKFVENIHFQINHGVEKFYPDLISFNIPKILKMHPKMKRKDLYEIFVQYKTLIKICIALNKSMKILKQGMDFKTFFHAIPGMKSQGIDLAKKIFETINGRNNNYLTWDEFMKGMLTYRSKEISEKIEMFFKIIDADGNGLLSYDEVYELSVVSLQRGMGSSQNMEVVQELAEYFANLIFTLVGVPKDAQIPLQKVRDKIILRGKEAAYLEMFVCADGNNDGEHVITFS